MRREVKPQTKASEIGMNFEDKVVIVTGASSGIGESCVKKLLNFNARVAGFDMKPSKITSENYNHYMADVRDEGSVKKAVDDVDSGFGRIDATVNCAGIFSNSKPFYDMSFEEWDRVISTNLTGTFLCSKHIARKMIKNKKGKIVNISCIRSMIFKPNMTDYSASKGGVVALTSAMALDLAPFGIQVNSVAPGFTFTGMTENAFSNPEVRSSSEKIIPLGRIAESDDIANVALFLLSDLSNYITGETIFVDGGFRIWK